MITNNTIALIIVFSSLFLGIGIGYYLCRYFKKKEAIRDEEEAKEFLAGKRPNVLEIDGKKYDATKFKMRKENGEEEVLLDVKTGFKETLVPEIKKEEPKVKTIDVETKKSLKGKGSDKKSKGPKKDKKKGSKRGKRK